MKRTILIAEADGELRDVYRDILREYGYDVETATNGLDCLAKLRKASPAVVVLDKDLRWGGADGVLAWIREERFQSDLPVILTAKPNTSSEMGGETNRPVVRCLTKPFTLTALLESVHSAIENNTGDALGSWGSENVLSELYIG